MMIGSPVFIRDTGRVIGLHFAGAERTVGCAIPFDGPRVHSWIDLYQRMLKDPLVMNKFMITAGGDLLEKESAS